MSPLEGTVKLPGVGTVQKKYVVAGGGVVAAIVFYVWWNGRQGNAGTAGTAEAGEPVGDELLEDTSGVPATDYVPPVVQNPPPVVDEQGVITNNAQWAQAAVAALTDVGVDTLAASAAVGRYLAGMALSPTAADIIRQAVALVGEPPVGEHPIKLEPVTGTPPPVPGQTGSKGKALPAPTGLKTWGNGPSKQTVPLTWNKVTGADYYRIYRAGVAFNVGSSEDTQTTIGGLKAGTSYTFHVRAIGDDGAYGPASAKLTVKTKK